MRFATIACLLASSVAATACVVNVDSQALIVRDEKRFVVRGTPELHLTTFDGSIEIRSWDNPDVLVEIEKRGPTRDAVDALVVESDQSLNRIVVEVKRPRRESLGSFGFRHSSSARLVVSVPRETDVVARSGDGAIRVAGLTGKLELRTGDGSIRASEVDGDLTLKSGDGAILVDRARGRIDVDTGDGGVDIAGHLTGVRVRTGDGAIVYRADPGVTMTDDWEITTGDGGVTIYLPSDFSAELDAHTGDGSIRNELRLASPRAEADATDAEARPATGPRERGENSRHTVRGRLGDGGRLLRIRTGDGTIRLRAS